MPNQKLKVVYSLRIHVGLQSRGFKPVAEMRNPSCLRLNCWVYIETPSFLEAFDELVREGVSK